MTKAERDLLLVVAMSAISSERNVMAQSLMVHLAKQVEKDARDGGG